MGVRYSQMTKDELAKEISSLKNEARKVGSKELYSEYEVLMRKVMMAESYLMNPTDFEPGEYYIGDDRTSIFKMEYLNGIFAWGLRGNETNEMGVPISVLRRVNPK